MKKSLKLCVLGAAAGMLLPAVTNLSAQVNPVYMRFNTSSTAANWTKWWGSAPTTIGFDGSQDVAANAASGSLKVTAGFNFATYGGDNQFAIRGALSGDGNLSGLVVDASKYDRLEFDLYWDPSSPMRSVEGDFGGLDVGLVPTDYSQIWFPDFGVTNVGGGWQHISLPISSLPTGANLSAVGGLVFKMWSGGGDGSDDLTGTATFWVDNIKLLPKGFITDFDNQNFVLNNAFWNWWGGATRTVAIDPAMDAGGDTNSGSLNINVSFPGGDQYSEGMSLSGQGAYNGGVTIHIPDYASLDFDLRFDTNSTLPVNLINTDGDPQGLGLGLGVAGTWAQTWIPNAVEPQVATDGQWHHVSIPLDKTWPDAAGLIFKKYYNAGAQYTGNMNFWMDNIRFIPSTAPVPPPTMALTPAKKGLTLVMAQAGQQYQRESIEPMPATTVQWIGNPNPLTYSVTIADFPDGKTYGGVQAHIFLVPDGAGGNATDYADPNAIMFQISANANNGGAATFRWKTNQPNANSQMYTAGQGQVGTLNAPSVVGKWTLTFQNNTNILVTGPGGVSTNWVMPPDAAAMFYSSTPFMATYFGVQPNNNGNIGQHVTFSEIKIDNGTNIVDDTFSTVDQFQQVDIGTWTLKMDDTAGIFVVDQLPAYWLGWTLPDSGFTLQQQTSLSQPASPSAITPIPDGPSRLALIRWDSLPDPTQSYFFLQK